MTEFSTGGALTAEILQEGFDLLRKRSEEERCCDWQHPLIISPDTPPEEVYEIVRAVAHGTATEVDEIAWREEHAWRERQAENQKRLAELPPVAPSDFNGIDRSVA